MNRFPNTNLNALNTEKIFYLAEQKGEKLNCTEYNNQIKSFVLLAGLRPNV